jgi:uncharacterized protein YdhG (YjbR/CyaY superfamily)
MLGSCRGYAAWIRALHAAVIAWEAYRDSMSSTDIDEYLAAVNPKSRALLRKLRKAIHALVPEAEECISYRIPAFRCEGRVIAGFSATSTGCSYYPFSGTTLKTLAKDIASYSHTKSALHFGPDKPLPDALVRKLLKARMAEGKRRGAPSRCKRPPSHRRAEARPIGTR